MRKFLNLFLLVLLLCLIALIGSSSASAAVSTPPALAQQPPPCVLFGDFSEDGEIDIVDIMQVASKWRCECGEGCYDSRYDIDNDCDIDVVDIMKIAVLWGYTCDNPLPPIEVCGSVSEDTTWTTGNVYLVTCDVTVNSGVTLTVQRGVVVKFNSGRWLTIDGSLLVQGTDDYRVIFTSWRDDYHGGDTNGDGAGSQPAPGDWRGIFVGDTLNLSHAVVQYGGSSGSCESGPRGAMITNMYNIGCGTYSYDAEVNITQSTIAHSGNTGVLVGAFASDEVTGTLSIDNSTITDSTWHGISVESNVTLSLTDSTITNNGSDGVNTHVSTDVVITDNVISNNSSYGLRANYQLLSPLITGNTFNDNGGYAAYVSMHGQLHLENNSGTGNGKNAIWLSANITEASTLPYNPTLPYVLVGTVAENTTLTVEPGVVAKFDGTDGMLEVYGSLVAQGTAELPIVFTSLKDDSYGGDTNGDGAATQPAPGDWRGIFVGGTLNLSHAVAQYGGNWGTNSCDSGPVYGTITNMRRNGCSYVPYDAAMNITQSTIAHSADNGVLAEGTLSVDSSTVTDNAADGINVSGNVTLTNSTITDNSDNGVDVGTPTDAVITDNVISNNGSHGLRASYPRTLSPMITGNTFNDNGGYAATVLMHGALHLENNSGTGNSKNAIWLSANITETSTLPHNATLPYVLVGTVAEDITLTVEPGVVAKLDRTDGMLEVYGNLVAQGITELPIVFTSLKDDSYGGDINGDGAATQPAPGDWRGIFVGGTLNLSHAVAQYGGNWGTNSCDSGPVYGTITNVRRNGCSYDSYDANMSITQSTIAHSADNGILAAGTLSINSSTVTDNAADGINVSGNVTLTNNTITNNSDNGVDVSTPTDVVITGNTISGNGSHGIRASYPQTLSPVITDNTLNDNGGYAATVLMHGALHLENNSGTGNDKNAIWLSANITETSTLPYNPTLPYVLVGMVAENTTLTVEPGVVAKLDGTDGMLEVYGSLVAQGTAELPIVFTSLKDDSYGGDTNGDGAATQPAPGDWRGIFVGGTLNLSHAVAQYGGNWGTNSCDSGPVYGTITNMRRNGCSYVPYDAAMNITQSTIAHSADNGVLAEGTLSVDSSTVTDNAADGINVSGNVTLTNSTITDNSDNGIKLAGSSGPPIVNNNIHSNGNYGLYNSNTSITINAENNWWGHESGPEPYGYGNGINYHSVYSPTLGVSVIDKFYVDADPWLGKDYWIEHHYGSDVPWNGYEAEPVNTATGNYTYQHTDLSIPTRSQPLEFTRSYNSRAPQDGPLGFGWTHNYNVSATENITDSMVLITYSDGRQDKFTWDGAAYVPNPGAFSELTKVGNAFILRLKDQTVYNFNASGKLASVVDRNGNTTTLGYTGDLLTSVTGPADRVLLFTYNGDDRLTQAQDPSDRTIAFSYDGDGNLSAVTDVLGFDTTYTYDADHRLLTATDANGHVYVTNVYDSAGRVVEQYDAQGNQTTFAYDEVNHQTLVTDPLGNTTTYQYDDQYRLQSQKDPLNFTVSYTYDDQNNRTSVTDKKGNTTSYAYDERGNTTVVTDTLGYTTTLTYDAQNNPTSQTDAQGYTTSHTYDANANLTSTTDPLGNTTTFAYDGFGQMTSTTDANGNTTQFSHNAYGYQTAITDALGNATTFTYDIVGRRLSETDALGRSTSYTYDLANRMLTISEPLGKVTAYTYDPVGNRISITNPRGGATVLAYDEKDRLVSVTDPLSHTVTYGYDAVDNQTVITDALGHATTYTYDALNRRASVTDPLGNTTSYGYDANGNRTSLTDANSNVTQYSYDALDRLISVTDAEAGTVAYTYDAVGNRTAMTDANSHTTSYAYDALNRLITVTNPLSYTVAYTYDAVGNRTGQAKADSTGITYTYDALNRLTETSHPSGTINYAYDAVGNRTAMTDTVGLTDYTYDDLNRLTQAAGPNGTLSYSYDLNDNRSSLAYPDSKVITYTYDLADRLTTVTDWDSRVTAYTYDDANRQTAVQYPNSTQAAYIYDNADRLLNLTHTSLVSGTITVFTYTLDAVGNRLTMQDLDGVTTYAYDDLYRLTQVTYPDSEIVTYAYDPMGNRTAMTSTVSGVITYTYDAADRLLAAGPMMFTWDANGNMIGKGSATYTFDALDRLTQVVSGTTTVQFTYDGDGVRLSKTVSGTATSYVQDTAAALPVVLAETTAGQTSRYVYGNDLLAQVDPVGNPSFYHSDGLGSTRALSNLAGQRTDAYSYDVFGSVRSHTGGASQTFTFTGEQVDDEVGLVYLRARYYDPAVGRFVSRDRFLGQFTKTNGLNPYVYALNRPNTETDPEGLFSWPDSFGSYAQASAKLGPVGLSLALDIDVPAAEFRLSLNFIGRLLPKKADLTPSAKAVAGFYAGSAGETSLGVDAFYGQGLIAGGSASRGFGNRVNLYAGVGAGSPVTVGGSQRLRQWRLQAENTTFQRAIGTAMPFIPIARWAIVKLTAPHLGWLDVWNLANPAFGIPRGQVLGVGTAYASSGDDWGGPPSGGK